MLSFMRLGDDAEEPMLVVCNFTPTPRPNYRLGVQFDGHYREVVNSDAREYGGGGQGNMGLVESHPIPAHGRLHSIVVTVPPLGALFFKRDKVASPAE